MVKKWSLYLGLQHARFTTPSHWACPPKRTVRRAMWVEAAWALPHRLPTPYPTSNHLPKPLHPPKNPTFPPHTYVPWSWLAWHDTRCALLTMKIQKEFMLREVWHQILMGIFSKWCRDQTINQGFRRIYGFVGSEPSPCAIPATLGGPICGTRLDICPQVHTWKRCYFSDTVLSWHFLPCVRVMSFPNKPSTTDAMSSPAKGPTHKWPHHIFTIKKGVGFQNSKTIF